MSDLLLGAVLLPKWRELHGYSQTKGAEVLRFSQPTLSDWEAGRKVPSTKNLVAIEQRTGGFVPVMSWLTRASAAVSPGDDQGNVKGAA